MTRSRNCVYKVGVRPLLVENSTAATSCVFSITADSPLRQASTIKARVKAIGDHTDFLDSNYAVVDSVHLIYVLPAPQILGVMVNTSGNIQLEFSSIENATEYQLIVLDQNQQNLNPQPTVSFNQNSAQINAARLFAQSPSVTLYFNISAKNSNNRMALNSVSPAYPLTFFAPGDRDAVIVSSVKTLSKPFYCQEDGYLYFRSDSNLLYKASNDGQAYSLNVISNYSPYVYKGLVYFCDSTTQRLAVLQSSGNSNFLGQGYGIRCSPIVVNDSVYWHNGKEIFSLSLLNNNPAPHNNDYGISVLHDSQNTGLPAGESLVVYKDTVYFLKANQIWCVNIDASNARSISGLLAQNAPCVAPSIDSSNPGDFIYFRDMQDNLVAARIDGSSSTVLYQGIKSSPVVVNEDIYFQRKDNQVMRIRYAGSRILAFLEGIQSACSPSISDNYIYVQGTDNALLKKNIKAKNLGITLSAQCMTIPVTLGEYIYFNSSSDQLLKVKKDGTGNPSMIGKIKYSPFAYKEYIYFCYSITQRLAVLQADGRGSVIGQGYGIQCSPIVVNDSIYWHNGQKIFSLSLSNSNPAPHDTYGLAVLHDSQNIGLAAGEALVVYKEVVYFLQANQLWSVNINASNAQAIAGVLAKNSPCIAPSIDSSNPGDFIYFRDMTDNLVAAKIDGSSSKVLYQGIQSSPVVFGNYIYFLGTDNKLLKTDRNGNNVYWINGYKASSQPFIDVQGNMYFSNETRNLIITSVDVPCAIIKIFTPSKRLTLFTIARPAVNPPKIESFVVVNQIESLPETQQPENIIIDGKQPAEKKEEFVGNNYMFFGVPVLMAVSAIFINTYL